MSARGSIQCPSCGGALIPVELRCESCEISVLGRFVANEFALLREEDLHFLRIFVRCEGRIRDMESAMGVSYPTIKARMAQLKQALANAPAPLAAESPEKRTPVDVLKDLEAGRISYDHALEQIRRLQQKGDAS